MVTIEVLNKSGVVRREVKMTDGETKMKATLASLKSVSFGEIFGNRPSEKVCQLVSSRFHIKLGRVPIRYDGTLGKFQVHRHLGLGGT